MGKAKIAPNSKAKRKTVASSSSRSKEKVSKQKKMIVQVEVTPQEVNQEQLRREQREREEQARRDCPLARPEWKGGLLTDIHGDWQEDLFDWKMKRLNKDLKDGFMCEKEIDVEHFRPFGLVQKFEALGWEAALGCYDGEQKRVYMEAVHEWVGSLEMDPGSKPPETMKLSGWVGEVNVTMSFDTLNEIAKFDSKEGRYSFPSEDDLYNYPQRQSKWKIMLKELLESERGKGKKIKKEELKLPLRLLLTFVQQNVMPRRSDRGNLRFTDVLILYALMKGKPKISYRYLVMMNIWTSRNSREKGLIPHCRLITALLKKYGAINEESKFFELTKGHTPFLLDKLGPYGWEYVKTECYHKLKNAGKKWRALRPDARMLLEGEDDELESEDSGMGESEGDDAEEVATGDDIGTSTGVHREPLVSQFEEHHHTHGGEYQSMEEFVEQARPEAYSDWPDFAQALFDQNTRGFEQQRRDIKKVYERNEHWNRVHAYNQQEEINLRFEDDRRRRMYAQWCRGEKVVVDSPFIDFSTLLPRDGSVDYPEPSIHHSQWVAPQQPMSHHRGESSSGSAVDSEGFRDTMREVFGDPQPPYH